MTKTTKLESKSTSLKSKHQRSNNVRNKNIFNELDFDNIDKRQNGGKTYSVKSGDNLSMIAKQHGVPLNDIISENKIINPSFIKEGQVVRIPERQQKGIVDIHKIRKGDTLSAISKRYKVGVNDLKKFNNLPSDMIREGATLNIPESLQNEILRKNKTLTPSFKTNRNISNEDVIKNHYRDKQDEYVVIDKKSGKLNIYNGGTLKQSINVGTGKNEGDLVTGLGGIRNYYTGAGVYSIASPEEILPIKNDSHNQKLYGDNILGYKNEHGIVQGSFLHQVPNGATSREIKIESSNPKDKRMSQGCVNCKKSDFESIIKNLKPDTKLYVLPEEEDNFFEEKNGRINFTTNSPRDVRGYNYTYDDKGNYLSDKVRRSTYKDFEVKEGTTEKAIFDNRNTKKQVEIVSKNKKRLMEDLKIDSDTYDQLGKQVLGHIKAETGSSYGRDIAERFANTAVDVATFFGSDLKGHTSDNISRGALQIRYNQIPENVRKKYGVNSPQDLDDINKAIPIAMYLKKDGLQQVIAKRNKLDNLTRENIMDFVPYQYNQAKMLQRKETNPSNNKYVKRVLDFANKFEDGGNTTNNRNMKFKKRQRGGNGGQVLVEDEELYKDVNGNIMEVDSFSHDDPYIEDERGNIIRSRKGNGGQIVSDAESVASASYNQVKKGDRKNTKKEEILKYTGKESTEFLQSQGLSWFKTKKSFSPSDLIKEAITQTEKYTKKFRKDYAPDTYGQNSLRLNSQQMDQLPTDEDIYDLVFEDQEMKKEMSGEFEDTNSAQYGGKVAYVKGVFTSNDATNYQTPVRLNNGKTVYVDTVNGRYLNSDSVIPTDSVYVEQGPLRTHATTFKTKGKNPPLKNQYGGIPVSEDGVYEYPNQPVVVPSNRITMQDVGYSVDAYDADSGEYLETMNPEEEYYFTGVDSILEIPQAQDGIMNRTPWNPFNSRLSPSELNPVSKQETDRRIYYKELYDQSVKDVNKYSQQVKNASTPSAKVLAQKNLDMANRKFNYYSSKGFNNDIPSTPNSARVREEEEEKEHVYPYDPLQRDRQLVPIVRKSTTTSSEPVSIPKKESPTVVKRGRVTPKVVSPEPSTSTEPPFNEDDVYNMFRRNLKNPSTQVFEGSYTPEIDMIKEESKKDWNIGRAAKDILNNFDPVSLGRINRNTGTFAARELMKQNRNIDLPYRPEVPNRTFNYSEEDATPYLDEIDSAVNQQLQFVNSNTSQGQAILNNIMSNASKQKRQVFNKVNAANLQRRGQTDNANIQLLNQYDMTQEQNNMNYTDGVQRTLAAQDASRLRQAEYVDQMINNRTRDDNAFLMSNIKYNNIQIDPTTGEIVRIAAPMRSPIPEKTKKKFGGRRNS